MQLITPKRNRETNAGVTFLARNENVLKLSANVLSHSKTARSLAIPTSKNIYITFPTLSKEKFTQQNNRTTGVLSFASPTTKRMRR